MTLEIGKIYTVNHSRKGTFDIIIESEDDEWVSGTIFLGTADAILKDNIKKEGEKINVRKSLCTFKEI